MKNFYSFLIILTVLSLIGVVDCYAQDIYETEEYKEYRSFAKSLKEKHDQRFKIESITEEELKSFDKTDLDSLLNKYTPNWKNNSLDSELNYTPVDVNANMTVPLIFISFSMPETLIKGYIEEAKRYRGVLVLRGLINHSLKQTVQKLREIENKDEESDISIIIHPHLFDLYQVKHVPTIVLAKDNLKCVVKSDECLKSYQYDKISGSVTIKYALEKIEERGSIGMNRFAKYFLTQGGDDEI